MSKRYGRNQRRKHREEIKQLQKRINRETVFWATVDESDLFNLEKLRIMRYRKQESRAADEIVHRELELEVAYDRNMFDLVENRAKVMFLGEKYIICNAEMNRPLESFGNILGSLEPISHGYGAVEPITLHLEGVA